MLGSQVGEVTKEVKEFRFFKGKVCPFCHSETVSKNVKYNNKQRYICKSYKKTFTDFTNSATYKSRKSLDKWLKYAKCMLNGYYIRKSAEIVVMNIATSFYSRHKIINCISTFLDIGSVDGVIEADEVFFAESFKGKNLLKCQENLARGGNKLRREAFLMNKYVLQLQWIDKVI